MGPLSSVDPRSPRRSASSKLLWTSATRSSSAVAWSSLSSRLKAFLLVPPLWRTTTLTLRRRSWKSLLQRAARSSSPPTWFSLTNSPPTLRLRSPPPRKFLTGGWALITVRRLPRRSRPNSLNARPSSGTDPWVSSNSMPLPRAPSTLPIPLQNSPARVLALSSAVVTPSLLSRRRASLKRCPMSLLAAVLPLSFLRARSSLVLLLWTSFKRTASWLPLFRHRAATAKKTNHRPGGVTQLPTPVTSRLPGNWYGYSAFKTDPVKGRLR